MKKFAYILIVFLCFACNSEDANDCFQKAGSTIQEEVVVTAFETILVNRNVSLILKEGPEFQVIIETGRNLINDVEVKVVNNQLRLTDNNTCNFVRDYNATKVYVTAPNITEIRSSTQFEISSDGVLNYPDLKITSEDFNQPDYYTVGDFNLQINSNQLRVVANNISAFYISGQTQDLNVGFFSGTARFEGRNLIAQNVDIYHRGSNDIIVNPQQTLTGELRGTGDLIAVNQPAIVEVEELYTGRLIFN
ncbi:MAG: head GIN domain-containing protein [Oceanihabitans sp.]